MNRIVKAIRSIMREYSSDKKERAAVEALMNLRLFCDVNGLDFFKSLDQSYQQYLEVKNAVTEEVLWDEYFVGKREIV